MAERRFGRRIPLPSVIAIKHQIRIVMELERVGFIRESLRAGQAAAKEAAKGRGYTLHPKLAAKKQSPPK